MKQFLFQKYAISACLTEEISRQRFSDDYIEYISMLIHNLIDGFGYMPTFEEVL
jgi:hypothetical protein